ncbi:MAG: ImmA/IrrE family metallo-endopeptidase [Burkholderiales bacterium]|nr:ImmA/IrrE family metallo-endopeptidase [Burkholderiales bacterium]
MKNQTQQIEQKAAQILRASDAYRAPIPLESVVNQLGLIAQARGLADASGVLVVENGRGVIGYNSAHSSVRQRFTIAHEIGHYVLHVKSQQPRLFIDKSVFRRDDESSTGNDHEEVEANQFAAALLMPSELVRNEIKKHAFDLDDEDDVGNLAKRFNVSTAAMSFRLENLGLLRS